MTEVQYRSNTGNNEIIVDKMWWHATNKLDYVNLAHVKNARLDGQIQITYWTENRNIGCKS
jgi:hypothetical protein